MRSCAPSTGPATGRPRAQSLDGVRAMPRAMGGRRRQGCARRRRQWTPPRRSCVAFARGGAGGRLWFGIRFPLTGASPLPSPSLPLPPSLPPPFPSPSPSLPPSLYPTPPHPARQIPLCRPAVQRPSWTQCAAAFMGTERRLRRPHAAQLSLWNQGDDDSCYVVPTLFFDMTTDVFFMVRARARARCGRGWVRARARVGSVRCGVCRCERVGG